MSPLSRHPTLSKSPLVPLLAVAFGIAAFVVIIVLQNRNGSDRDAQLKLAGARTALTELQTAPLQGAKATGGDPEQARGIIERTKQTVNEALAELGKDSPPPALAELQDPLRRNYAAIDRLYTEIDSSPAALPSGSDQASAGPPPAADPGATPPSAAGAGSGAGSPSLVFIRRAARSEATVVSLLEQASDSYAARAERSGSLAIAGSAAVILFLLGAFGFFYRRSRRLQSENAGLLKASQLEALTDPLTGLANRRALLRDLETRISEATRTTGIVLALYDLNGFKHYNDSFGHPAGDALLARLGGHLADLSDTGCQVYRMGGDEFCLIADASAEMAVERGVEALSEVGDAFRITASFGSVSIPDEATATEDALRLADQRMYTRKAGSRPPAAESIDVLLKVLDERDIELRDHLHDVARLAELTALELGLDPIEVSTVKAAAELHDIGKSAIPDTVLNKPGPLDPDEWEYIRRHTLIGERIVLAAPSLAPSAGLIRSSHERVDGGGYPDGLRGKKIPLGSRIIAVCDAFDVMTSTRPYKAAVSESEALDELRRCSGSQFDPAVVQAFTKEMARRTERQVAQLV